MKSRIIVHFLGKQDFELELSIKIPKDWDEEEYLDEVLNTLFSDNLQYDWDFV